MSEKPHGLWLFAMVVLASVERKEPIVLSSLGPEAPVTEDQPEKNQNSFAVSFTWFRRPHKETDTQETGLNVYVLLGQRTINY